MTGPKLFVRLEEPHFRKLVAGERVAIETVAGDQVELILADIGWGRMLGAIETAREAVRQRRRDDGY